MKYPPQPKQPKKTVTQLLITQDVRRMNKEHRKLLQKGEYTSERMEKLEARIDRRSVS